MRDVTLEETLYFNFTTRAFATGVPTVLAGTPVLSVLESNNITAITAGVSVAVDRASVVGLNQATVVATAANGYEAGKSYAVYISTGTVGGVSVVGEVVAEFTVQSAAAFTRLGAPAGASVSADIAAAKVDTAAIKVKTDFTPSATAGAAGGLAIAGSNAATTFAAVTVSGATTFVGNVLLSDGLTVAAPSTANRAGVTITGNGTGDGIITTGGAGAGGDGMAAIAGGGVSLNATLSTVTTAANLTNLPAITANWLTAAGIAATALNGKGDWNIGKTGYALSVAGVQAIWDALTSALTTVGSVGKLIVDNINATISSVKAKTDLIPAAPAAVGDIPTAVQNADALLDRNMATGTDSGSPTVRTVRQALRFLRNKWSITAGTLTVTKEDDVTASFTATVTTDAAAVPIIGNDPA